MSPQNQQSHQEKFSYLIISRMASVEEGDRVAGTEVLEWARLTEPVIKRPRRVHCQLCCPTGELKRLVVTARLHNRYGRGAFKMRQFTFSDRKKALTAFCLISDVINPQYGSDLNKPWVSSLWPWPVMCTTHMLLLHYTASLNFTHFDFLSLWWIRCHVVHASLISVWIDKVSQSIYLSILLSVVCCLHSG